MIFFESFYIFVFSFVLREQVQVVDMSFGFIFEIENFLIQWSFEEEGLFRKKSSILDWLFKGG